MAQGSSSVGRKESSWYYPCVSGKARFMQLLYDPRDDAFHERIGSQILYWLDDLDAIPLHEASPATEGFLFAGARPINDYRGLVAHLPLLCDKTWEQVPSFLWGNQPPPDWLTPAPPPLQDLPTTALRVCSRSPASPRSRASSPTSGARRSPASPRSRASSPTSGARKKPGFSKKPGFFSASRAREKPGFLEKPGFWNRLSPCGTDHSFDQAAGLVGALEILALDGGRQRPEHHVLVVVVADRSARPCRRRPA